MEYRLKAFDRTLFDRLLGRIELVGCEACSYSVSELLSQTQIVI